MKKWLLISISIILLFTAGFSLPAVQETIDMSALRTEIASTVIAEIYATVNANTAGSNNEVIIKSTPTPSANTSGPIIISSGTGGGVWKPTPTYYSYAARLVSQDKNYMLLNKNEEFNVTWTFQNTGPLPWDEEFCLVHYKGMIPKEGEVIWFPSVVDQRDTVSVTLHYTAPEDPGIHNSYWEIHDNEGVTILDNIWVGIQVRK